MSVDFSLIVPVYNTPKKYIRECVESILLNKNVQYEILLVNDGSGEEISAYANSLADQYSCMRVFPQMHAGVSRARNKGMLHATGDYISFVDADDCLAPGILDRIFPLLREYEPDLLITQISRNKGEVSAEGKVECGGEELKNELRGYYLTMRNSRWRSREKWLNRAPHGRFLRRELAVKNTFLEEVAFGEDVLWNFSLLNSARRILLYLQPGYYYRWTSFSVTQNFRENFPDELRILSEYYKQEIRTWPRELYPLYEVCFIEYFTILMRVYVLGRSDGRAMERYREEISRKFWKDVFRKVPLSQLSGHYLLAAFLGKTHQYRLLYFIFWLHHRRMHRGTSWKHMEL